MTDDLGLREQVQHTVADILENIRNSVRTVEVHIALVFVNESLVALGMETLPESNEVRNDADVGTGLDIEVAGIEITSDIQAGLNLVSVVGPCE